MKGHEVNNLLLSLSWKNKYLLAKLKKKYGWSFDENLQNYLVTYRKEIAKE